MALAPSLYNLLLRRYPQGDGTGLDYIRTMVTEGIVKAPVLKKAGFFWHPAVSSALCVGQDMAVGYNEPAGNSLEFYVIESIALVVRVPEAICVLK